MVTLRDYRSTDFDALWRLDQECFDPGIAYTRFELGVYIRGPAAFTLVAEQAGQIVGFVVCHFRKRMGHVITIDVSDSARRVGVGSKLLLAAEERLREKGCTGIFLETAVNNPAAIRFYVKHGYTVLRTIPRYYAGEIDALSLGKKLTGEELKIEKVELKK